jgi:signal transduction histidine kinase
VFGEVRAFAVRHPRWVDAVFAAMIGAVNADRALTGTQLGGVGLYVAVHLLLVWRRAAPVVVCWAVFGTCLLTLLVVGVTVEGLYPEAAIAVAVYTVARHGSLRHLVPIVAVVETLALTASLVAGPQWTAVGFVTFGLAAAVLLGLVVRTRRVYLAELEDRARRLERDRDQRAELAVAAERTRIARDMHDIVAHHLSVMVTLADAATLTAGTSPDDAVTAMRHVSVTGRQALGEMRRVLGLLHTGPHPDPQPQPGLADLDALIDGVRAAGLHVEHTVEGVPGELGAGMELAVYRILQEALTNVLKHAGASSRAAIRLRHTAGRVELEVVDDGPAGPRNPSGTGPESGTGTAAPGSGTGTVAPGSGRGMTGTVSPGNGRGTTGTAGTAAPGSGTGTVAPGSGRGMTGMAARAAAYGGWFAAGPRTGGSGWSVRATLHGGGGEGGP